MALHFTASGDIETIAPQEKGIRPAEYALFRGDFVRSRLAAMDCELIGMRGLRDTLRSGRHGGTAETAGARMA